MVSVSGITYAGSETRYTNLVGWLVSDQQAFCDTFVHVDETGHAGQSDKFVRLVNAVVWGAEFDDVDAVRGNVSSI